MYHQKSMPYNPQENRRVESFNKILENSLTNIFNPNQNDWYVRVLVVLWVYRTTYKKLTGQTLFKLVYGQEDVDGVHLAKILVAAVTNMDDWVIMEECLM